MVDPDQVIELEARPEALHPPRVAVLPHALPVVDGVAPVLPGGAELVGRRPRHQRGRARLVRHEELGRGPHLDRVARDVDGDVAYDAHAAPVGVALEAGPLAEEEVLGHLVVEVALAPLCTEGVDRRAGAAELLRPLPEGPEAELLLADHELAVGREPGVTRADEGVQVLGRGGQEAGQRALQQDPASAEDGPVVDATGVVPQLRRFELALLEPALAHEPLEVDEVGVSRMRRERLVGGVPVARGGQGEQLPVALAAPGEKVHELSRRAPEAADAPRPGQRERRQQDSARTLHVLAPLAALDPR